MDVLVLISCVVSGATMKQHQSTGLRAACRASSSSSVPGAASRVTLSTCKQQHEDGTKQQEVSTSCYDCCWCYKCLCQQCAALLLAKTSEAAPRRRVAHLYMHAGVLYVGRQRHN